LLTHSPHRREPWLLLSPRRIYSFKNAQETIMPRYKNKKLTAAAKRIGTVVGRAEGRARKVGKKAKVARKEVEKEIRQLTKSVDRLARELKSAGKRLRRALT
jgi:hypothetical protein